MGIRIITDSASDMVDSKRSDVTFLPLRVIFGDTEYRDGIDITRKEFYEKLVEGDEIPKTSQITPFEFGEAIKATREAGEDVLVITLSSKLSGTYQSAAVAASEYDEGVAVVDSANVSVGEYILVEYAIRLKDEGRSLSEIVTELEKAKEKIHVIALLDTLEYLKKGGRISKAAAFAGGLLSIKPVIAVENGEVVVLGKARGSKQGNNYLKEQIKKAGGVDYSMPYVLGYSGLDDSLLQKYISDSEELWKDNTDKLDIILVGGAIGTHAGPGAIAVAFYR